MKEKIMNSGFVRKIAEWKAVKWLSSHPFFGKFVNYEMIAYVIAGVLTTVVNYVTYFAVRVFLRDDFGIIVAQIVAFTAAVIFAFFVNKIFVFDSPSWRAKTLVKEMLSFIAARLLSFGLDTLFVYVTVGLFKWNEPLMKILSNVIVLILNYFASKFIIFRKKKSEKPE